MTMPHFHIEGTGGDILLDIYRCGNLGIMEIFCGNLGIMEIFCGNLGIMEIFCGNLGIMEIFCICYHHTLEYIDIHH
jgi:hypothetical protein